MTSASNQKPGEIGGPESILVVQGILQYREMIKLARKRLSRGDRTLPPLDAARLEEIHTTYLAHEQTAPKSELEQKGRELALEAITRYLADERPEWTLDLEDEFVPVLVVLALGLPSPPGAAILELLVGIRERRVKLSQLRQDRSTK